LLQSRSPTLTILERSGGGGRRFSLPGSHPREGQVGLLNLAGFLVAIRYADRIRSIVP
jgi:hypothetical protein